MGDCWEGGDRLIDRFLFLSSITHNSFRDDPRGVGDSCSHHCALRRGTRALCPRQKKVDVFFSLSNETRPDTLTP